MKKLLFVFLIGLAMPHLAMSHYYFSAQVSSTNPCCIAIGAGSHTGQQPYENLWSVVVDGVTYDTNDGNNILHCVTENGIYTVDFVVEGYHNNPYGTIDVEVTGCGNDDCDNIELIYEGEDILGFSLEGSCEQEPGRIFFQSEYRESGGTWEPFHNAIVNADNPYPAILGLAPCTTYEVRFRIKCDDVYGEWCEFEGTTQCPCEGPSIQCRRRNITQGTPWTVESDCAYTACIGDNVRIQMRGIGGNGPFTYNWSGGIPTNNPSVIRLPNASTDYTVTVTDANGCSSIETFSVIFINCCNPIDIDCETILIAEGPIAPRYANNPNDIAVNLYPNPAANQATFEIGALEEATAQITLTNSTGKTIRIYNEKLQTGTTQIQIDELSTLPTGVYFYQIQVGDYINYGKLLIQ